jgi:hypothetical protein
MVSPTLQTLQDPILLLPWPCFRRAGFPNPMVSWARLQGAMDLIACVWPAELSCSRNAGGGDGGG